MLFRVRNRKDIRDKILSLKFSLDRIGASVQNEMTLTKRELEIVPKQFNKIQDDLNMLLSIYFASVERVDDAFENREGTVGKRVQKS